MIARNKSRDFADTADALLNDSASSVNVDLATLRQYGAMASNQEDEIIVKTLMDDYGNEYKSKSERIRTGTIFSSTLNLSNTVIGAGILGIPSAVRNSGYVMGVALFLFVGLIAAYTMHLSMCVALCVEEYASYDALCRMTIPRFKKVVDIVIGLASWGVLVAYFVVIADAMDLAMEQFLHSTNGEVMLFGSNIYPLFVSRPFWMCLYLVLFIMPSVSLKKMDSLKFTSFFALFIFVVIMIMVILYWLLDDLDACPEQAADHEDGHEEPDHIWLCREGVTAFPADWAEFVKTASIFVFAYECHTNLWPIRNELKVPTISRLTAVGVNTTVFCTALYAVVGYAGYLTFGSSVKGNILRNYPQTVVIGLIRVGLSFAITFSFPVCTYPARECFATLCFNKPPSQLKPVWFYGSTYFLVIAALIVAIVVDDLEVVLAVIGDIGGNAIVFIIPATFYYFLSDHPTLKQMPFHACKKQSCVVLIVAGVCLGITGLVLQFTSSPDSED